MKPAQSSSLILEDYPFFQRVYKGLPPHNYVTIIGKFWYFGEFSQGLDWEVKVKFDITPKISLEKIRSVTDQLSKKKDYTEKEMHFDSFRFEHIHNGPTLVVLIALQTNSPRKETVIGFRELIIHLKSSHGQLGGVGCHTFEGQPFSGYMKCPCSADQGLNKHFICQDCPANCESCTGIEPSHCLSCSAEGRWNGVECSTCHWGCKTCTGPTQHECSVCNSGYYNYGNGTCLKTCEWPFREVIDGLEAKCIKPCKSQEYIFRVDDTCIEECKMPYIKTKDNEVLICEDPCSGTTSFLYWNQTCIYSCPLPLRSVQVLDHRLCENPCEGTFKYLYLNSSCLASCPAPLQIKSEPGVDYCVNPCSTTNIQSYLYSNGSCHSTCLPPLRVKIDSGVRYCLLPCNPEKEYILGNGSCSAECLAPLMKKLEPGVGTHCLSPCESDDHFVAKNGSCLRSCPSFFDIRIDYGVKYCLSPCYESQYYLEHNQSCLETCPYPLKTRSDAGAKLCQNACSESNDFLYDDQSCHKNCPKPLISLTEPRTFGKYCKSPCNAEGKRFLSLDGSCQETCDYPYKIASKGSYQMCLIDMTQSQVNQVRSIRQIVKALSRISEIGGLFSSFVNAGDPTSLFMMPLLHMLKIIRYTDAVLPGNLELSLNGGNFVQSAENRFLKSSDTFKTKDLQDNFDEKMRLIGVICLITLMLNGVLKVIPMVYNGSKLIEFLKRCSSALQWNILATLFIQILGDIVLFCSAAFYNSGVQLESPRHLISLFVVLPLILLLVHKIIKISSKVKEARENSEQEYFQRWRFIFEIYKNDRPLQSLFVLIFILRIVLVSLIIGCLEESPLLQAFLLILLSCGMISYLVWASPIQRKISYIQHMALETVLLLYNTLFVILAKDEDPNIDVKNALGQLMIVLYLATPTITAAIIVIKILHDIYSLFGTTIASLGLIEFREITSNDEENTVVSSEESNEPSSNIITFDEENNDSNFLLIVL